MIIAFHFETENDDENNFYIPSSKLTWHKNSNNAMVSKGMETITLNNLS